MDNISRTSDNIKEINLLLDKLSNKLIEFKKNNDKLELRELELNKREERIEKKEKIQKEYVKNKEEMFRKMNEELINRRKL